MHRTAQRGEPAEVLNLFGYTGLASLVCAKAGAKVTHVDASKKAIGFARDNQREAGLERRADPLDRRRRARLRQARAPARATL